MSKKSPGGPVSSLLKYPQDSRQQIFAVNTIEGKPIGEGALEKFSVQYSDINVFDLYAIVLNIVKVIMKLPVGHTKTEALKERLKESLVLEPCICIEMILSNGSVIVFELSMAKFHYLRYNVATVLKEMESLQNRRHVKGAV
ncbi:COMM domain-containing protein 5 [Gryllus bimaculatus]|nr:COMM domain-containing protein 5 [Gryllus bimaculatus]